MEKVRFKGEDEVESELVPVEGGSSNGLAVSDFNVMWKRRYGKANVTLYKP